MKRKCKSWKFCKLKQQWRLLCDVAAIIIPIFLCFSQVVLFLCPICLWGKRPLERLWNCTSMCMMWQQLPHHAKVVPRWVLLKEYCRPPATFLSLLHFKSHFFVEWSQLGHDIVGVRSQVSRVRVTSPLLTAALSAYSIRKVMRRKEVHISFTGETFFQEVFYNTIMFYFWSF